MWIKSNGTYVMDQRVERQQDLNTESVLNVCVHEKCWWETIASQSKLRSNWWTCFAHFTVIQPEKVSLPEIRNVNSFRKTNHLQFILCQKENLKQHLIFQTGRPLCARMAAMARPIRLDQQDCLTLAQVISRQLSITINSVFIQTIIHHLSFADSSVLLCPHHGGARLGSDPPGEQKIERAPFQTVKCWETKFYF